MFSVNVPVPGEVRRLAGDLRPSLLGFESVRDEPTLVVKRLGSADPADYAALEKRARAALQGAPAFEARVTGVDFFADPPTDPAPVVYLAVESPGLRAVHERLVDALGAVEGLEGDDYVPHVTLARGGDRADAARLAAREVTPIAWTVTELQFYDATHGERAGTVSLPA